MFFDRLKHTAQSIDVLLRRIHAHMEPRIALNGEVGRCLTQSHQFLSAVFRKRCFLIAQRTQTVPQHTWLVIDKSVQDGIVLFVGKTCHVALCTTDMFAQQIPKDNRIMRAHHQSVSIIFARSAVRPILRPSE